MKIIKKIKNFLIDLLLILVILASLGFVFQKSIRNTYMKHLTNSYQLEQVDLDTIKENKTKEVTYDFNAVTEYKTIQDFDVKSLPAIGGIAIPELGINLLVFNGLDNYSISYGAGTMSPTQEMGKGNYSLVSHHVFGDYGWGSDLLFSPLDNAERGMKIYLTDKNYVYEYEITEIFTVDPYETQVLDEPGENQSAEITLITCTDSAASRRIIVKGKLVSQREWASSLSHQLDSFKVKYNY